MSRSGIVSIRASGWKIWKILVTCKFRNFITMLTTLNRVSTANRDSYREWRKEHTELQVCPLLSSAFRLSANLASVLTIRCHLFRPAYTAGPTAEGDRETHSDRV